IRIRSEHRYTYQDTFWASSFLPSATSGISAGRPATPGVPTISNLLIGKFNPDHTTGGDATPLDRDGPAAELDAPLELAAPVIRQSLGQFLVLGVGTEKGLHLLARLEWAQEGVLTPHVLIV